MILQPLNYFYVYYNINFIKIFGVAPFTILSVLGAGIFILKALNNNIKIPKKMISGIFLLILLPILITFFYYGSYYINQIKDPQITPFNKYMFRQLKFLFASYFMFCLYIKVYKQRALEIFLKNFVIIVLFENLLALFRFLSPKINLILSNIQIIDGENSTLAEISAQKMRLIGFGEPFFGAGIINSVALIIITFLILNNIKNKRKYIYIIFYFTITILGFFSSRTTIVGVILSVIYYLKVRNEKKNMIVLLIKIVGLLLVIGCIFFGIINILKNNIKEIEVIYEKFIIAYGKASLEVLLKMWQKIPETIETFVIGDAKWNIYDNGQFIGYYKKTDVGYLRIIWSMGIIGLSFFIFNLYSLTNISKKVFREKIELYYLIQFLFYLILVLNTKGYVDLLSINYFILVYSFYFEYTHKYRENIFATEESRIG